MANIKLAFNKEGKNVHEKVYYIDDEVNVGVKTKVIERSIYQDVPREIVKEVPVEKTVWRDKIICVESQKWHAYFMASLFVNLLLTSLSLWLLSQK